MRPKLLTALAAAAALAAAGCTSDRDASVDSVPWVAASAQLASYGDCDDALQGIQDAVLAALTGWEDDPTYRGGIEPYAEEGEMAAADDSGSSASSDAYSQTNNQVAGVDEPDTVKTDGTYLYTVAGYELRSVDTRTAEVAAERDLDDMDWDHQLFLADGALFLMYTHSADDGSTTEFRIERLDPATLETLDVFAMEGSMLDARMVDGEVRLVVSSQPQVQPVWDVLYSEDADQSDLEAAVRDTAIEDWLPDHSVNGEAQDLDCSQVAHPDRFTGSSVTVFSLPTGGDWEGTEPATIMADGGTVHGTADSLYIAHYDYSWDGGDAETELYRFLFTDGTPRLAGEATVSGSVLNQYALSEYDGHLRVATTENDQVSFWWDGCGAAADCASSEVAPEDSEPSKSTVTVFAVGEDSLTETGSVTDLGIDEQIYAVRFIGDTGYVVTFRQTDPLYTIDLSDPENPVVTGELKITGYSGYLHPVGEDRLLGVGQEATEDGVTTGLQVSLFDTGADEAAVLDQYYLESAESTVQWDPHAFLYWEDASIVVLPVTDWSEDYSRYRTGAMVLDIGDDSVNEAAWIEQEAADPYGSGIQRVVVVGDTLWTVSDYGVQANELGGSYDETAWVEF